MSGHERERLSAYLDGELRPAERAGVEAHLAACPECTAFLAELAAVDETAASLPAAAPEGYFDNFPARVRARLQPRRAALPVRRVPVWTWAAAAALLLAVITPLTLRHGRPAAYETRPSAPAALPPAKTAPTRDEGTPADRLGVPEPKPTPPPSMASRPVPTLPSSVARGGAAAAAAPPANQPVARPEEGQAAEGAFAPFAREPAAAPPEQRAQSRAGATADAEADRAAGGVPGGVVGGVVAQDASNREKAERTAPRPAITAAAASPMTSAASAGDEATPASLKAQEDAFLRLEAVRPRTAAGWRRVREQWKALAAAETDPVRADEERVRAVIAAREAWRAEGDGGDEAAFRAEAESYLRRDDARQKARVEGLLAEAPSRTP